MSEDIEFSEESLRKIASQKVSFRFSVKVHAVSYILVSILLVAINAIFIPKPFLLSAWWAFYPVLGWLIGLMIHTTAYWLYARGTKFATRGIVIDIVAYIFTMILLGVTDSISDAIINWAYWPGIFWGLGIVGHIIISMMVTREKQPGAEVKESRKEQAIEKEMQKLREKMKNK